MSPSAFRHASGCRRRNRRSSNSHAGVACTHAHMDCSCSRARELYARLARSRNALPQTDPERTPVTVFGKSIAPDCFLGSSRGLLMAIDGVRQVWRRYLSRLEKRIDLDTGTVISLGGAESEHSRQQGNLFFGAIVCRASRDPRWSLSSHYICWTFETERSNNQKRSIA